MKRIIFISISLIFLNFHSFSQITDTGDEVGIGTTTPGAKLDVKATGDGTKILSLSSERPWSFVQVGSGAGTSLALKAHHGLKYFYIKSPNGTNNARFLVSDVPSENLINLVPSGGKVGIGLNNPSGLFEAYGTNPKITISSGNAETLAYQFDEANSGTINGQLKWDGANNLLQLSTASAGDVFTIKDNNGNVGIGNDNPNANLTIGENSIGLDYTAPYDITQMGAMGFMFRDNYDSYILNNLYLSSATNWTNIHAGKASGVLTFGDGILKYSTAPAGTGNSTVTLTERFTILSNGNVGIGTTDPEQDLEVNGTILTGNNNNQTPLILRIQNTGNNYQTGIAFSGLNGTTPRGIARIAAYQTTNANDGDLRFYTSMNGVSSEKIRITKDGNIGIGTIVPEGLLNVNGSVVFGMDSGTNNGGSVSIFSGQRLSTNGEATITLNSAWASGATWARVKLRSIPTANGTSDFTISPYLNGTEFERMRVKSNGDVCIGTDNSHGYKLAVSGDIICEGIKVKLQSDGWPDYVFADDYDLPTLNEVENYIEENKHLPDVPSESEVVENGIELGEMNKILLQKIEELTLYTIELNKKYEDVKKENREIKEILNNINQ